MRRLKNAVLSMAEERTAGWWLREVTNGLLLGMWVLALVLLSSRGQPV